MSFRSKLSRIQSVLILSYIFAFFNSGCGSLETRSKNETEIKKVKSVAVVAFSVNEPVPNNIGLNVGSGKVEGSSGGGLSAMDETDPHAEAMYEELIAQLGKNLSWKVMSSKNMQEKPGYKTAFNQTMKGFQNKMPPGAGSRNVIVKNIMDYDCPRILDVKGRTELIQSLGVDAIVVARVDTHLTGTTVMGIGSRYPQSNLSFSVYTKNLDKPIWFEGQIEGETSKESVGKTGFFDDKKLKELSVLSAKTAFKKIGETTK